MYFTPLVKLILTAKCYFMNVTFRLCIKMLQKDSLIKCFSKFYGFNQMKDVEFNLGCHFMFRFSLVDNIFNLKFFKLCRWYILWNTNFHFDTLLLLNNLQKRPLHKNKTILYSETTIVSPAFEFTCFGNNCILVTLGNEK